MSTTDRAEGYRRAGTISSTVTAVAIAVPVLVAGVLVAEHNHLLSSGSNSGQSTGGQSGNGQVNSGGGGGVQLGGGGGSHAVSAGS